MRVQIKVVFVECKYSLSQTWWKRLKRKKAGFEILQISTDFIGRNPAFPPLKRPQLSNWMCSDRSKVKPTIVKVNFASTSRNKHTFNELEYLYLSSKRCFLLGKETIERIRTKILNMLANLTYVHRISFWIDRTIFQYLHVI